MRLLIAAYSCWSELLIFNPQKNGRGFRVSRISLLGRMLRFFGFSIFVRSRYIGFGFSVIVDLSSSDCLPWSVRAVFLVGLGRFFLVARVTFAIPQAGSPVPGQICLVLS